MPKGDRNYTPWPVWGVTTLHLALAGTLLLVGVAALLQSSSVLGLIAVIVADAFVLGLFDAANRRDT